MADEVNRIQQTVDELARRLDEARQQIRDCAKGVGDVSPSDVELLKPSFARAKTSLLSLDIHLGQLRDSVNQAAVVSSMTPDELRILKLIADGPRALTTETLAEGLGVDRADTLRRIARLTESRIVVNMDDGDGPVLACDLSVLQQLSDRHEDS